MKNINIKLFFIIALMNMYSCKSQTIIIWGQKNLNLPSDWRKTGNYYYKDVNNYLDNFVGTWEYVNGNEKFQIILNKVIKYHVLTSSPPYSNYYEDGIVFKYKKYVNNTLVFESPVKNYPTFNSADGNMLKGMTSDYERVTKTIHHPQSFGGGVFLEGGGYFPLSCHIEKIFAGSPNNSIKKIKFKFYLGHFGESSGFGEYNNPIYAGQPKFSIPNDIIMTKLP